MNFGNSFRVAVSQAWENLFISKSARSRRESRVNAHDFVLEDGGMFTAQACASCTSSDTAATCSCAAMSYNGDGHLSPDRHTCTSSASYFSLLFPIAFPEALLTYQYLFHVTREVVASTHLRSSSNPDRFPLNIDMYFDAPIIRRTCTPPNPHGEVRVPVEDDTWGVQTQMPYQKLPQALV